MLNSILTLSVSGLTIKEFLLLQHVFDYFWMYDGLCAYV